MSLSIEGSIVLLDSIISNKVAYLEKSDNSFIKKEVENLSLIKTSLKDSYRMMEYLQEQKDLYAGIISKLQVSYRLLTKLYEMQILGKLDVKKIGDIEQWKMDLNRLIKTPKNA